MRHFRTITAFLIKSERLDASVFTSTLPATERRSRTCATRATDVISERKHCSRRRRHTHRSNVRRCVKAQTKRRQSHANGSTVPETKNAGTQGRPVAGLTSQGFMLIGINRIGIICLNIGID